MDNKKLLEIFGLNIKIERIKKKLSQEELAHQLGFSTVYISNIELGKHNLSLTNAIKLSSYFKKSIEYLLEEKI
jgi:transcriptional regulator with XRE-family HTH domain